MTGDAPEDLARRLLAAKEAGRQVAPLSDARPGLTLAQGYDIAAHAHALRVAEGDRPVGRKIGFTNRTIWGIYGVYGPLWGWVYDSTLADLPQDGAPVVLPNLPELRLEPEIAFRFARTPDAAMTDAELAACIDGVAHGVELVFSLYPGWRFTAADSAAAFGMHAALLLGPMQAPGTLLANGGAALAGLRITLDGPGIRLRGRGSDVLDGPLQALRFLLSEVSAMPGAPPIQPGEIVTTGTLTDAVPVARGETWTTHIENAPLSGLSVSFA